MNDYDQVDSDLVERLQNEFRQPVPAEMADVHLGRLQKVTAGQALSVRNRYRASLAVAAAAVAVLALQLSASVFTPTADIGPAAAPTAESERPALVARVEPDAGQARDDGSRRLIGRPSSYLEAGDDSVEASVAVLDSVSTSVSNSDPQDDGSADGQPTASDDQAEIAGSVEDSSTTTTVVVDSETSKPVDSESNGSESNGSEPNDSEPSDGSSPTTTPTTPVTELTTSTSLSSTTLLCPETDSPGNSNANRPTVRPSTTVRQGLLEPENCDDTDRQNGSQGKKGNAQGLQPE